MNRKWMCAVGAVLALRAVGAGEAKDLPLQSFTYHEDFETRDPVQPWATNGEMTVNEKGLSEKDPFSGRKCFRLDVTLTKGSYWYWSAPVRVPCEGTLKFSARIRVEKVSGARVGLGANFVFPPTHHSGCGAFDTFDKPTMGWRLVEQELTTGARERADSVLHRYTADVTGENVGVYLDRWGIFIYGHPGGRVVLCLDDVRLEGKVPEEKAYEVEVQQRFAPARKAFHRRLEGWRARLTEVRAALATLPPLPPAAKRFKSLAERTLAELQTSLTRLQRADYASPEEADQLQAKIDTVRYAAPNIRDIAQPGVADRPFVTYAVRPITNAKILPTTFPVAGRISSVLSATACPGEYEPVSFAVSALEKVDKLKVTPTDLVSANSRLPASAVDVRVVKCWYQAGVRISDTRHKVLVPELLLKDDGLVRVDTKAKQNYLRTTTPGGDTRYILLSGKSSDNLKDIQPRDADTLQPLDLDADTTRQFWVTVHVPPEAKPGGYVGHLNLTAAGVKPSQLTLRLRVLPFHLAKSALRYSLYYRGRLTADGKGSISSETKSPVQYEAEMRDMKAHGVLYPTIYQSYSETLLPQALTIRRRAGLPTEALYSLGLSTGNPTTQAQLDALKAGVEKWKKLAARFGYRELYIYGIDEATGERLKSQRAAWKAVHEAGGKVFVACYKGTFEVMGDLLDLAVYAGPPVPEEAKRYHDAGHRIFCYANPQVGVEEPETYRRNFGLLLWKAGYDGAMDYAYQHSFTHGWNDFDDSRYRDHNFTYETVDGVIDTVEWEGFREGVDDVRYVTTLVNALRKAKTSKPAAAQQAQRWLNALDPGGDLDKIREQMVEWIMKLLRQKD